MAKEKRPLFDRSKTPALLAKARSNAGQPVRDSTLRIVRDLWPVVTELRRQKLQAHEIAAWLVEHADLPVTVRTVSRAMAEVTSSKRSRRVATRRGKPEEVGGLRVVDRQSETRDGLGVEVKVQSVDGSPRGDVFKESVQQPPAETPRPTFRKSLNGAPNSRFRDS